MVLYDNINISYIIIGVIFSIIVIFLVWARIKYLKYKKIIVLHSKAYNDLLEINGRYKFHYFQNTILGHKYDNESYFILISEEDYLIYNLQFIQKEVLAKIAKCDENKKNYKLYLKEIKNTCIMENYEIEPNIKFPNLLNKIEKKMCRKQLKTPDLEYYVSVSLNYINMGGRLIDKKSKIFYKKELLEFIDRINLKQKRRFLDEDVWKSICKVERGKVSNKIRFMIYNRDNYRCCICHRKNGDLEIDHIIPISKGGKSEICNLQTLCHHCNMMKGNKLDY